LTKIVGGLAALAVLAVAGFSAWFLFLRDDGPDEVSTDSALEVLANRTATTAAGAGATAAPSSPGQAPSSGGEGLDGAWTVDTSVDSFVGYRVQEELVGLGGTTAVGRTKGVTGGFSIADGKASEATITADMTALKSSEGLRDGQLRNQGIEYGRFPTAIFKLAATDLPDGLEDGGTVQMTLKGDLTLHGVTKAIEMPAEVTFKDGTLVVVGQAPIAFADYSIRKPSSARVASIADNGVMEVQLFFKRA
jgi:polyisoprenoid-binding protein YceI